MNASKKMSTRTMVQAGFLVALSIVLTRILALIPSNTMRLSLGTVPLMISGFLFGPVVGGIAGAAADLIGIAINPTGPPHLGFTLSSMLWGIIPGLTVLLAKARNAKNPYSKFNIIVAVTISTVVVSLGLNTYWLTHIVGKGFLVLLSTRIISPIVNIPLQSIIIISLMKYLKNIVGE